ncbi:MAG: hypothetical protein WA215_11405 [Candidatus Cybelea sp.]
MRERDPLGAWLRSSRSQRRVGPGAVCASCGKESRPYGLIFGRDPSCCYRCDRIAQGQLPYEDNHVFGKRNSALTIRYPVNDHRAIFSVKQYRWPPDALENPNSSPLLEGVARMRGAYDNIEHMLAENREFAAKLGQLEEQLTAVFGPNWPAKLQAAAARKRAVPAAPSLQREQDDEHLLKQSSTKHESSRRRKGRAS